MKISQVILSLDLLKDKKGDIDIRTWMEDEDGNTSVGVAPIPGSFQHGLEEFRSAFNEAVKQRKEGQFANPEVFLELYCPEITGKREE